MPNAFTRRQLVSFIVVQVFITYSTLVKSKLIYSAQKKDENPKQKDRKLPLIHLFSDYLDFLT